LDRDLQKMTLLFDEIK